MEPTTAPTGNPAVNSSVISGVVTPGGNQPAQQQSDEQPGDFYSHLSPEQQQSPTAQKFRDKTPSEVFDSYANLQTAYHEKQDGMFRIPTQDSPPEEQDAFFKALGIPDSSDDYEMPDFSELETAIGDSFKPDPQMDKWFRENAHEVGITPKQFQTLYKNFVDFQFESQKSLPGRTKEYFGNHFDGIVKSAQRGLNRITEPAMKNAVSQMIGTDPIVTYIMGMFGDHVGESKSLDAGFGSSTGNADAIRSKLDEVMDRRNTGITTKRP